MTYNYIQTNEDLSMTKQEMIDALMLEDFSPIYHEADRIRKEVKGDDVFVRSIIEFSNYCIRKCKYCGINCFNDKVPRYRMSLQEIVETAEKAIAAGYRTIVLQSGEDPYFNGNSAHRLGEVVSAIRALPTDYSPEPDGTQAVLDITLSVGELPYDALAYLRECGATRYLLRHETSDPELYSFLHPCGTLADRIQCLRNIKKLGYATGSGFMVGLPGQTLASIADDVILLETLECDMAGIGPFISSPDTQLAGYPNGSTELTKRAVALCRIHRPELNLPVTTALGVLNPQELKDAFSCGANVIMKKVTPTKYKAAYQIYPSEIHKTRIIEDRQALDKMIRSLGRRPV
jgi:biotin synthase